jgi:hypothetical protein
VSLDAAIASVMADMVENSTKWPIAVSASEMVYDKTHQMFF